jgi:hypothetical protein
MKTVVAAAAVLILSLGLTGTGSPQWPLGRDASQAPKSGETFQSLMVTGRYQMFVSPHIKGHTFMIDTDTGRVWIMKKDNTTGDFSLQRIPVEEAQGQQPEKHTPKKTSPPAKE